MNISVPQAFHEHQFPFNPEYEALTGSIILDGYWQSEKYFAKISGTIREEFEVKPPPSPDDAKSLSFAASCDSVFVHVRRGDYVSNPEATRVHGLCPPAYYQAAANIIQRHIKNPVFFVFSDDISWAQHNLPIQGNVRFIGHNDANNNHQDLRIMAACKHAIIANSSFSWWGAWLIRNTNKIVIAPKQWFANDLDPRDLIPESWQKV